MSSACDLFTKKASTLLFIFSQFYGKMAGLLLELVQSTFVETFKNCVQRNTIFSRVVANLQKNFHNHIENFSS